MMTFSSSLSSSASSSSPSSSPSQSSPRSSSSPSLLRLFSLSSLALLFILPTLITAQSSPTAPFCGGAGIDLTPLSTTTDPTLDLDLVFTDGDYWYGLHPCGVVKESFCPAAGAMMCEYGVALAYPVVEEMVWEGWSAGNGSQTGVVMSVANGPSCELSVNGTTQPRAISVTFVCDAGVAQGSMISVTRPTACSTEAIVLTRHACPASQQSASDPDTTTSTDALSADQKRTIAVSVSIAGVAVLVALTVLCVVLCRRWRSSGTVWVKAMKTKTSGGNKLLEGGAAEETAVELSVTKV